jgi:peptidoglycan/xylan/chitin deacetylase (PgdA/CDA1 family)
MNYHRVGEVDKNNPFHKLHTVSESSFKKQILFLKSFAQFVNFNYSNSIPDRLSVVITFDDVSRTIYNVLPFLKKNKIPFIISPCVENIENGYGIRDKVYFIEKFVDIKTIKSVCQNVIGNEAIKYLQDFSFYKISKSNYIEQTIFLENIINPLFNSINNKHKDEYLMREYLSWDDIENDFKNNEYVTISNHGLTHFNYDACTENQIIKDIVLSHSKFKSIIDVDLKNYTIPFGRENIRLKNIIDPVLISLGYQNVFWVGGGFNSFRFNNELSIKHYSRIHTPNNLFNTFILLIKRFIKHRKANYV